MKKHKYLPGMKWTWRVMLSVVLFFGFRLVNESTQPIAIILVSIFTGWGAYLWGTLEAMTNIKRNEKIKRIGVEEFIAQKAKTQKELNQNLN